MENIAIYGGSFNPPTKQGHFKVIEGVLNNTDINKIIITPSGERMDKNHNISHTYRRKMIEVFLEKLKESGLNTELDMYFFEGKNNGKTTTLKEEKYFRDKLGLSPTFIYGTDVIENMHKWIGNSDKYIEQKLKKIFVNRPGYDFNPIKYSIDNYILLDIPEIIDISSSIVREMIKNKQSVKDILDSEILKIIDDNNLYI
ncbi:MAG: nicotinate-nicotinamide nucleotide adenylyltransferase [Candidatus Gracilibacteria bacterium]|nr:nicotinate-nicotinamide nucleotide adenylyltransferase [Candidatus Gracilibacteria bacterium]